MFLLLVELVIGSVDKRDGQLLLLLSNTYKLKLPNCMEVLLVDWFFDRCHILYQANARLRFLCGGDLLESFATPGLWDEQDVSTD